ncbi:MAG: hypothetical protein MET45_30400 [Nostoc sp. LLA-1]|nr:hypothetical protein [Cyanocohniella sp. LLY]
MSLQLAVGSKLKKVPERGVIERNCWIKALNLASLMPKPASAQADKPGASQFFAKKAKISQDK